MTQKLAGKIAVVTAAAQGIGRASALALARAGASVFATDIAVKQLKELSAVPGIETHELDVLSGAAISDFAQKFPDGVDILFNCAGIVHGGSILECAEERMGVRLRPQRHRDVPHDPRLPARDDRARRRVDHQYVVGRLEREGGRRTASPIRPPKRR